MIDLVRHLLAYYGAAVLAVAGAAGRLGGYLGAEE
jgi:hypothetical protein